ncbi:hypothetical protein HZU75_08695 [Chitinibacter fontanus]|uniref:Uncharacterized protein n=1 Tax=Chitinibacter fontanus TaxID=1737446 RepID=A0A7D5Z664_9NEIS|nr:hypothetical protein [Chitinibacter fontanus]QLI81603.1 hypothetical protein HZU75_08695 [Chitinibacter fontanus]
MNIIPGIGIGKIKYGMYEHEVIDLLGKPDRVDESEYVEGMGNWYRELWYTPENLTFTFKKDDQNRLGTITVMGGEHTLFSKKIFGKKIRAVSKLIVQETNEIARYEDWSSEELPEHECLLHNGLGIMFWFDFKELTELQCSYLFKLDSETIIWPVSS